MNDIGQLIQASIWPSDSDNHDDNHVDLSLDACVDYMNQVSSHCHLFRHPGFHEFTSMNLCDQVKSRCSDHGGELDSLETSPDSDGGDWIKSPVKADPRDDAEHWPGESEAT